MTPRARFSMRVSPFFSLALFLFAGCRPPAPPPCPTCAQAKLSNKWCDKCKVGYVAGVPIKTKLLFECLDAHGHDVDLSTFTCPSCRAAIPNEGFCEKCRVGWVHRKAYFSRLTYHLAKGRPCDPATIACAVCKKNSEKYGWCSTCGVGMIGNVAISNRADFDGGCRGYDLMMAAIETSKRCETCSLAMLTDTRCPFCKIWYKDSKPVLNGPSAQAPYTARSNAQ